MGIVSCEMWIHSQLVIGGYHRVSPSTGQEEVGRNKVGVSHALLAKKDVGLMGNRLWIKIWESVHLLSTREAISYFTILCSRRWTAAIMPHQQSLNDSPSFKASDLEFVGEFEMSVKSLWNRQEASKVCLLIEPLVDKNCRFSFLCPQGETLS